MTQATEMDKGVRAISFHADHAKIATKVPHIRATDGQSIAKASKR
jgi:hypothetical protein